MSKSLREKALTALRQLIRREPTLPEIANFFTAIRRGNDRSTAVLAATLIDDLLKRALLSKLRNLSGDETDRLFGPDQPLGSLSAKIKLAYAMDLCNRHDAQNLEAIRAIRNAFAHDAKPMSFKTPEVNEVCYHLHVPDSFGASRYHPKQRYLWVIGDQIEKLGLIAHPELYKNFASRRKSR